MIINAAINHDLKLTEKLVASELNYAIKVGHSSLQVISKKEI